MELIAVGASSLCGVLATWIKLTNDITRIKARVDQLERQEGEVKLLLKDIISSVQEIKLLLAEKGIK